MQAHELMEEVTERFRAVWALSNKIRRQPPDAVPSDLGQMAPKALSFWIASMFGDSQPVQQLLLQVTLAALRRCSVCGFVVQECLNYPNAWSLTVPLVVFFAGGQHHYQVSRMFCSVPLSYQVLYQHCAAAGQLLLRAACSPHVWLLACRLRSLSDILDKHVSYLRAAVALESLGTTTANPDSEPSSETAEGEKAGDAQKDQPPSDDDATSQKPSS